MTKSADLLSYIDAAPAVAFAAHGFGPGYLTVGGGSPRRRLSELSSSPHGAITAVDSAGRIGQQVLSVVAALGGTMTAEAKARETAGADPDELQAAIDRLCAANLLEPKPGRSGDLVLGPLLAEMWQPVARSMADPNAMTAHTLNPTCQALGVTIPKRKQDKIDAIAAVFADPDRRAKVRAGLSRPALDLLDQIAARASFGTTHAEAVGLNPYLLDRATDAYSRYGPTQAQQGLMPLRELATRGIVGVAAYEGELWIWQEAWPLLERPFYQEWPSVPAPEIVSRTETQLRLPPLMALVEKALQHWRSVPPKVLKNDDNRFAKTMVRSTAKALGTTEEVIELISRMALNIGLFLPNTVATSGRGRKRQVDQVWMADPDLMDAWSALSVQQRWLRLVSEWVDPRDISSSQLHANRHLVLWELAVLPAGQAWPDPKQAARWIEHRHMPMAVAAAVEECFGDLQALGIVTTEGPVCLTALGRLALDDVDTAASASLGSADEAVIQADHTIIAPPDLDPTIAARLEMIAELESDGGAQVYRLSEKLITTAVQNGDDPDQICAFLDELSSVPLADTVKRLVVDAAARAGRVKVLAASTIVVTTDPADLATACSVKAAKLEAIAPTVAITSLTPAKVRAALDRKGLSPELVTADSESAGTRRSSDDLAELQARADKARQSAERSGHAGFESYADQLAEQVAAAREPMLRLKVQGPLALTPALAAAMAGKAKPKP